MVINSIDIVIITVIIMLIIIYTIVTNSTTIYQSNVIGTPIAVSSPDKNGNIKGKRT